MCGRYTRNYTWAQVHAFLSMIPGTPASNVQPRFNICPTQQIDIGYERDGKRQLVQARWGLIPSWWSKPLKELKLATFNARAETVAEKPFFRSAFKSKRCIIPASGYYEWKTEGKEKQPYYFTPAKGEVLAIAGLWDEWEDKAEGKRRLTATMVITGANTFVSKYHDRMPVLLKPNQFDGWLSGKLGKDALVPAPETFLKVWPVSKRVNSSRADDVDATLIEPI